MKFQFPKCMLEFRICIVYSKRYMGIKTCLKLVFSKLGADRRNDNTDKYLAEIQSRSIKN